MVATNVAKLYSQKIFIYENIINTSCLITGIIVKLSGQCFDECPYFISYTPVVRQGFLLCTGVFSKPGRVVEILMNTHGFSGEKGAVLLRMAA